MFYGNTNTDYFGSFFFLSSRLDITCRIRSNHNLYLFLGGGAGEVYSYLFEFLKVGHVSAEKDLFVS